MPMMKKSGKPKKKELPKTLRKSGKKAQRTFAKAHDAAAEEYGEGQRAHRVAYSALKSKFEKAGDRWEKKDKNATSARGGTKRSDDISENSTKKHLTKVAQDLDIRGRSSMKKSELAQAIKKAQRSKAA